MAVRKKGGLGKGLGALIPQVKSVDAMLNVGIKEVSSKEVPVSVQAQATKKVTNATSEPRKRPVDIVFEGSSSAALRSASGKRGVKASASVAKGKIGEKEVLPTNEQTNSEIDGLKPVPGATFAELAVVEITPNLQNPRSVFNEEDLNDLANSIKLMGLHQPIVVRPITKETKDLLPKGKKNVVKYELIMGERRLRATKLAGLDEIPAIIRETEDQNMLRDALVENLHRVQLNPLEEASAYQQLIDDFGLTQEQLSSQIAKSRSAVANTLRLLTLPAPVQKRVAAGVLSSGHARQLVSLKDVKQQEALASRIVAEGLSVRQVEEIVSLSKPVDSAVSAKKKALTKSASNPELKTLASSLENELDTRVDIRANAKNRGQIIIDFADISDLQRLIDKIL